MPGWHGFMRGGRNEHDLARGFPGPCRPREFLACSRSAACYTTGLQSADPHAGGVGWCGLGGPQRLLLGQAEAREAARAASLTLRFASTHALALTFFPGWLRSTQANTSASTISLL